MGKRTGAISWVHFGDLHLNSRDDEHYADFINLIDAANEHLAGHVDFAFFPGDNADTAKASEYELVRSGIDRLRIPVQLIPGDHDCQTGTLELYQRFLEPKLYRSVAIRNFQLLFLNAMDAADAKTFDLGSEQMAWLKQELANARAAERRALVFVHLYPSEMLHSGAKLSRLLAESGVELVEMGHTHYNEVANDGRIVYATTRSTGQIEEGPPGFSITVIDGDVISWKFKEQRSWPFVMITSPTDHRLLTDPSSPHHIVKGMVQIRARAWDARRISSMLCSIDDAASEPMQVSQDEFWQLEWDANAMSDGLHQIHVTAKADSSVAHDTVTAFVCQRNSCTVPERHPVDLENVVGAWPEKGILGTQLGPNKNGSKGPWPSWKHGSGQTL